MKTDTLAINLRQAFIDRKTVKIAGGKFYPEELRDGGVALAALPYLVSALHAMLATYADTTYPTTFAVEEARAALEKVKGLE